MFTPFSEVLEHQLNQYTEINCFHNMQISNFSPLFSVCARHEKTFFYKEIVSICKIGHVQTSKTSLTFP